MVTGVWVGNDDYSPMIDVTGGELPAEIWSRFMRAALKGHRARAIRRKLPDVPFDVSSAIDVSIGLPGLQAPAVAPAVLTAPTAQPQGGDGTGAAQPGAATDSAPQPPATTSPAELQGHAGG
jgi:penicillin-binding protein 1A